MREVLYRERFLKELTGGLGGKKYFLPCYIGTFQLADVFERSLLSARVAVTENQAQESSWLGL